MPIKRTSLHLPNMIFDSRDPWSSGWIISLYSAVALDILPSPTWHFPISKNRLRTHLPALPRCLRHHLWYIISSTLAVPFSLSYIHMWKWDLSLINLADWNKSSKAKYSSNTATLEAAYMVPHRWFWVSTRVAKSNSSYSDRWLWGCGQRRDRIYICWSCPRLVGFWSRVFDLLFTLFHVTIRKDAKLALLHCPIPGLFSYQQLATYLFIAAKHTIAGTWKKLAVAFSEVRST